MQATIDTSPAGSAALHGLAFIGGFTTEKRKARGDKVHVYRTNLQSAIFELDAATRDPKPQAIPLRVASPTAIAFA